MPQYGFGDWLDKNKWFAAVPGVGQVAVGLNELDKATNNGLQKNAGLIGTVAGGVGGAFLGNPMLGAQIGGSVGGAIQGNYNNNQQIDAQNKSLEQQKMLANSQYRNNLANSRLSQLQSQQSYQSVFKNGGGIDSTVNRMNPMAMTTSTDSSYYITPYRGEFSSNPNIRDFAPGYSFFTDPKYIPTYGAITPYMIDKGKIHYTSDYTGDNTQFKKAKKGEFTLEQLNNFPEYNKKVNSDQFKCGGKIHKKGGMISSYKGGGYIDSVDKNPDVTMYMNGGLHENNPNGGIPIGPHGTVEEGEVKVKLDEGDYIFSNRF